MPAKSNHSTILLTLLITGVVGVTGCQSTPRNPFAGLPVPDLRLSELPLPRLPTFPNVPRPNFGNLVKKISPAAVDAAALPSTTATNSPPPPSPQVDFAAVDREIADGPANNTGNVGKKIDLGADLTAAQQDFKAAVDATEPPKPENTPTNPWADYKPDVSPSSSNLPSPFPPPGSSSFSPSKTQIAGTAEPVSPPSPPGDELELIRRESQKLVKLRQQLESLRTRGTGRSDDFTTPSRSALELADAISSESLQPLAPLQPAPTPPTGLVNSQALNSLTPRKSNDAVQIPDPTAPLNVLRPAPAAVPGLVSTTQVKSTAKSVDLSSFAGESASEADPWELPKGNHLSQHENATAATDDSLISNKFVVSEKPGEPPVLKATAAKSPHEIELPRQISPAGLAAIEENRQREIAAAALRPQVVNQHLLSPRQNPQPVGLTSSQTNGLQQPLLPAQVTLTNPASQPVDQRTSAFNTSPNGSVGGWTPPSHPRPRVTTNQFFQAKSTAGPVARVAELPNVPDVVDEQLKTTPDLPPALLGPSDTYGPGSVRAEEKNGIW